VKHPETLARNRWFLLQENVPAHRSLVVRPCQAQCDGSGYQPYSTHLSPPDFALFPRTKIIVKFARAEEVTAGATRALREVPKTGFLDCLQTFKNCDKIVPLPKGTAFKEMLCKYIVLIISIIKQFRELVESNYIIMFTVALHTLICCFYIP
jgi:hypothetical protein